MRITNPGSVLFTLGFLVASAAILASACGGADTRFHLDGDSPYFASLDDVARSSTLALDGVLIENSGVVSLESEYPALSAVYGYRLLRFRVDAVRGQSGGTRVEVGDVLTVGVAATQESGREQVANFDEIAARVTSYSVVPPVGAELTIFASPMRFSNGETGWSIVGSSYGILARDGARFVSQAPLGPLAGLSLDVIALADVIEHLGEQATRRPADPYTQPSGVSTPRPFPN